jgi:hypothetical protein
VEELLPVRAFATALYDQPLEGTNKVLVPYYPLATSASRDFEGTYVFDGTETQSKEVAINKRKYQSMAFTSEEIARQPRLNPEELGRMKGQKLAEDVIADILSNVTIVNFGAAAFTDTASNFDSDDVIGLKQICDEARWPKVGRSLILDTAYEAALLKDADIKTSPSMAITEQALRDGKVPMLSGFSVRPTNMIPTNSENLIGMVVYQSALLVGFSPIAPAPDVREQLAEYRTVTDPASGLTLEYRRWGSPDSDTSKAVIEVNYGTGIGETAALKRMQSAAL